MSTSSYEWPTLAEEGREMLEVAVIVYSFADLRRLARTGKLSKGDPEAKDRILNLPCTVDDVMKFSSANKDELEAMIGKESIERYMSALDELYETRQGQAEGSGTAHSEIVYFDDANEKSELVYGIDLNHIRKRITVGFRGSVTVKDFMVDAQAYFIELRNPRNEEETIKIHHGFYEYLFGKNKNETKTKCEVIMSQVLELFDQYPDYRLYTAGHSLGAALATLFAAEAAASDDPRLQKPVTCIVVASPKVGDVSWFNAFQSLEKDGLIRCVRIANHMDAVTFLPDRSNFLYLFKLCQRYRYRHVGIEVTLYGDGVYGFSYAEPEVPFMKKMTRNWTWYVGQDLGVIVGLPSFFCYAGGELYKNHSCNLYMERFLEFAKKARAKYKINELYEQKLNSHRKGKRRASESCKRAENE